MNATNWPDSAKSESPKILWTETCTKRRFLIPDAPTMAYGDLTIRTATGQEMHVDPEAVKPYEVSDEEAKAWLSQELRDVARQLKTGLRDALLGPKQSAAEPRSEGEPTAAGDDGVRAPSATPGLDLLADIGGTPRESLTGDFAAIGRALRRYVADIATTAGNAVSGEPDRVDLAQERMRFWRETLRAHGIVAADVGNDDAGATSAEPQASAPPPAELDGVADRLRSLADEFRGRAECLHADSERATQPPATRNSRAGDDDNPPS